MIIKRIAEKELVSILKFFPAVAILGPRQSGKTTLVKQLTKHFSKKKTVYIDLENPDDAARLDNPTLFFKEHQQDIVIIDEVQRMKTLFPILRSVIDAHRKPGRFILLGSASPDLLIKSSESLAGRIYYYELSPLMYAEIKDIYTIDKHWLRGGFPTPLLARRKEDASLWHQSFLTTFIERDLPALGFSPSTPQLMLRLMQMLAHLHGNTLNNSQLAGSLGVSSPTIQKSVEYLDNAFIIRKLQPYFTNAKKRIIKSPKIYIRDSGILFNLLKITDKSSLLGHPVVGAAWEGYVIEQIINQLRDKFDYYYYRTQDGTEADLLLLKAGKPYVTIEIKFSTAPKITQGTYNSIADLKTKKNFIIIPSNEQGYYTNGKLLKVIGFESFMANILKLLK